MEKLKDAEILARLIYRAYIAPDPHAPLEAEALLPFQAALELYARTWGKEKRDEEGYGMLLRMAAEAGVKLPEETVSDSDREPEPKHAADPPDTHTHTQRPGPMTVEGRRPNSSPETARAKSERSMRG